MKQQLKVRLTVTGMLLGASALGAYVAELSLTLKPAVVVVTLGDGTESWA